MKISKSCTFHICYNCYDSILPGQGITYGVKESDGYVYEIRIHNKDECIIAAVKKYDTKHSEFLWEVVDK